MELIELKRAYPRAWHSTLTGGWERIRESQLGLASTSALLDYYGITGDVRGLIELEPRSESVWINADGLPRVLLRDQKPLLPVSRLERVLDGMSIEEWCRELNRRSYFFVKEAPLKRFLNAYRNDEHDVIVVDARKLVDRYESAITLSSINTGAIGRAHATRGTDTFLAIADYPATSTGRPKKPVAEIAVAEPITDIEEIAIRVERWVGPEVTEVIWRPVTFPSF